VINGRAKLTVRAAAGLWLGWLVGVTAAGLAGSVLLTRNPQARPHLVALLRGGRYLGRVGVVFQERANDCGAAALKMVFDHYGLVRPLEAWQREAIDRPEGSSMLRLLEVARKWGLRAEGWRVTPADLDTIPLPAIALLNRHHYVVVEARAGAGQLIYADPALGRVKMDRRLFLRRSQGEMLLVRKE
jgi:predicted double-glycine peptidase